MRGLLANEISAAVTEEALTLLRSLFADGIDAPGSAMAGRAELGIGDPANVSLAVSLLAADLLGAITR